MKTTTTEAQAYEALRLAQINQDNGAAMMSSAQSACRDAEAQFNKGDWECAKGRAEDSLKYSVGIFHPYFRGAR